MFLLCGKVNSNPVCVCLFVINVGQGFAEYYLATVISVDIKWEYTQYRKSYLTFGNIEKNTFYILIYGTESYNININNIVRFM